MIFFLVFSLFSFLVFSQNSYNFRTIFDLKLDNNYKISIIDSLLKAKENESSDSLHFYYQKYASWLNKVQKIEKAIYYQKKTIALLESKPIKDSPFYQNSYYYLGYYLKKNKQYSKCVTAYQKSLNINADSYITSKSYYGLGSYYKRINNFPKAIQHYQLAYSLLKDNPLKRATLRNWLLQIGMTYQYERTKKGYINGIKYCKKADSISQLIPTSLRIKYLINSTLATYYNRDLLLDIDKSFYYYQQALRIAKKSKDNKKISYVYSLMGSLFNTTDYDKSLFYLQKALLYTPEEDTYNRYTVFFNQSVTYAHKKNYKKSISLLHKALGYLINDDLINMNDNIYEMLSNSDQLSELRYALPILGENYLKYYEENKDPTLLKKSISYFKLSDYVIDLLMMNSDEYKSKLYWRKISTDIYGKAIRACYLDNNPEEAFYFMEKNKALLLMEDIATQNYRQTIDVPSKYLEKEKKLKQTLFLLKQKLSNTKNLTKTQIDSLLKEQLDTARELLIFQDSLYKDKNSIKEPSILSLQELQDNMQNNEVILEYHISIDDGFGIYSNNENGYLLAVTKGKNYFFEINEQTQLREEVAQLNKLVRKPFTTQESMEQFKSLSYTVYNKLFPSREIRDLIKNKKVSIVTDSYLSLLSFEALNTQKDSIHYLIEDCTINYQYSFSFLQNNTRLPSNNTAFLGMAPILYSYDSLVPLTNSQKEFHNLNKFYKGDLFKYQKATKENFIKHISKSNIIHLATHADALDSIDPWIAFSDAKLTLDELFLHKSNASLVVLSACNTTLGKEEVGEGIMSLARGFFYSGTQSVISSLWNVDDTSTPFIMNAFYQNLANGETKSVALRKAKLDYLNTHSLSEVSPHYWASFILLGKDNVLPGNAVHWELYLSGLFLFLVLFFLFALLKKRKHHRKG